MAIIQKYNAIKNEIEETLRSIGRPEGSVKIVAITKTHPVEVIQEALRCGITIFGENKVQEAKTKFPHIAGTAEFHLVGHLQSNKAKDAVKMFDFIHSIDKIETAIKIDNEAEKINKIQKILVQVNSSQEERKSGIQPDDTVNFIKKIADLKHIAVLGLMTMGPLTNDENEIRRCFRLTRGLLDDINRTLGLHLNDLSMGMSSDYRIAVLEGATIVRVGTALFGERDYESDY